MQKRIIAFFILVVLLFSTGGLLAQQKKVEVLGYEVNEEAPLPFAKTNKNGQTFYDSRVFGSPKFFPGKIITASGEEIEGDIALFNNTSDWAFVKRAMVLIPKGETKGQYLGLGTAILIHQKKKKEEVTYDYYNGVYLQRLVTGDLQLSYNPAANTSNDVSGFIGKAFLDSLKKNVVENSIEKDISQGKSMQESLEKAKLKADLINIASEVEIVEKEYLLYDVNSQKTYAITKENFTSVLTPYVEGCSSFNQKKLKNYKAIVETIQEINEVCR